MKHLVSVEDYPLSQRVDTKRATEPYNFFSKYYLFLDITQRRMGD